MATDRRRGRPAGARCGAADAPNSIPRVPGVAGADAGVLDGWRAEARRGRRVGGDGRRFVHLGGGRRFRSRRRWPEDLGLDACGQSGVPFTAATRVPQLPPPRTNGPRNNFTAGDPPPRRRTPSPPRYRGTALGTSPAQKPAALARRPPLGRLQPRSFCDAHAVATSSCPTTPRCVLPGPRLPCRHRWCSRLPRRATCDPQYPPRHRGWSARREPAAPALRAAGDGREQPRRTRGHGKATATCRLLRARCPQPLDADLRCASIRR